MFDNDKFPKLHTLNRAETLPAGQAGPPAPDGRAFLVRAAVFNLTVVVPAKGTTHDDTLSFRLVPKAFPVVA
ncbi:hypothetical protein APE01nite_04430 [Acetobacter peroxydans]|uniref:Uncharacterized protein n=1 Tax=Acetobacter peroxydans TaxID=104098 RepID=A0A4Y3TQN0_9PROT|nr:hypothetical protein APE01nite_04430 [Acetobacter peroxydans]